MSEREAVDFVIGDDPPQDTSDELVVEPRRPDPRLRWTLGGAAVVLAAVALIANPHGDRHGAIVPNPSPSTTGSTFHAPPDVVGVTQRVRVPEGNRTTRPPAGCPADAQCYEDDRRMPAGVVSAVDARFPAARLTAVSSLLANRTGRFGPDLVRRSLHLRAGPTDIAIAISKPSHGDTDSYDTTRHGRSARTRLVDAGASFTVTVVVTQDARVHLPSRATLTALATDPRLVTPQ